MKIEAESNIIWSTISQPNILVINHYADLEQGEERRRRQKQRL